MTFNDVLNKFRAESFTQKDKGTQFERLMRSWLLSDPRYSNLTDVWMWEDFPSKEDFGGKDTGIDLVARTETGDYWAIQCKCYKEDATIDKPAVDSFLATSSRTFKDVDTLQITSFARRVWISTTNHWGINAEEAIQNQNPPVNRVSLVDLQNSPVDWQLLLDGLKGKDAMLPGKQPLEHQLRAMSAAHEYFATHDRGKLIMACGTGKTYTALKIAEEMLPKKGLVLFLVPSISLLGQTLNAWCADATKPIKGICICSDAKASRKIKKDFDDTQDSAVDLAVPATTNPKSIAKQLKAYRSHDGLTVVFSTYQSIEAIKAAQDETLKETGGSYGVFDLIVCDEAHRTTGVKLSDRDESNFTKIHDADYIKGKKRLYMTATPRLYGSSAKIKASEKDAILCSMDDEKLYGDEFFRVNFSYAVDKGLLTDYKVLVLTVNEDDLPEDILKDIKDPTNTQLNFDDSSKLIGVINGLSKIIRGDNRITWDNDPGVMHRAIAFCHKIDDKTHPAGTSKNTANVLPTISEKYRHSLDPEEREHVVEVSARHIDGSMNSQTRNEQLAWLAEENIGENECRVLTNVRCLSEGIDVPALDAVLFLSSRNSQVDVVQSVGRVMRNFRKNQPGEKKYGYIIIPIVVPSDVKPEDALNNNNYFATVWNILNALRSHDDHFNAEVQKISLNKNKSSKVIVGAPGIGHNALNDGQDTHDAQQLENAEIARQLDLRFGEMQSGIYAKLVEKCGDRLYWENWSKKVGLIAHKFIERISKLVSSVPELKKEFNIFVKGLQDNLNPSVDEGQAIEMLAQHLISQPVFDALFQDYNFVNNNAVSRSMHRMIEQLETVGGFQKDTAELEEFYNSVRVNVGNIDNLEGKQRVIKNLYEKFFKGAFPLTVEKLGIVYTPIECVDFIIHSVNDILKREFNSSLSDENVHIIDPFTGTGTFITRLLQSGLIKPEDIERKYLYEIHCNEIVLLAYYIADVNIEAVYHDLMKPDHYVNYDGICLTDTFQLAESKQATLSQEFFRENSEGVLRQKKAPIRVIIGNPPYSVGQKSANDNAQNMNYPLLDKRIYDTYAHLSSATLKTSLYDSYIKAFRWSSDRLAVNKDGGIIAFISNGSWLDGNSHDGFRACLESEFTDIYVLNLRGNQRTSGELSRKEGGKIFGGGSRTPITITFLVKNPAKAGQKATIHYHDIGDYLTREQKLDRVKKFKSVHGRSIDWQIIEPTDRHDWINQRDGLFDSLIPLGDKDDKKNKSNKIFNAVHTNGIKTQRDAWCYGFSTDSVSQKMNTMIGNYNSEIIRIQKLIESSDSEEKHKILSNVSSYVTSNESFISWTIALRNDLLKGKLAVFTKDNIITALYRPFTKEKLYANSQFNERLGIYSKAFPSKGLLNKIICVSGVGVNTGFSCIITDIIPDLGLIGSTQCYPLYWYEENKVQEQSLFDFGCESENKYIRRDGISDWILKEVRNRFGNAKAITKEHIFYYVYGILHSPQYRERFVADLKKSLPRIPIVDNVQDFMDFYKAGKALAELHLNYEQVPPSPDVKVIEAMVDPAPGFTEYDRYSVKKMMFPKVRNEAGKLVPDKSRIIYNSLITIENIPAKAFEYIVNGKSAIEWIMERYAITQDSKSLIINNPNDWSKEHHNPTYIFDLLLSVINLSVQTVDIVNSLPKLNL
ncbi:MAG: DEAD/DEAH box helicase family protein [Muribaculaceae bacterium]|nr:DEAD/DEAH box helicase family protein [Muribaculaceae bacterium]